MGFLGHIYARSHDMDPILPDQLPQSAPLYGVKLHEQPAGRTDLRFLMTCWRHTSGR